MILDKVQQSKGVYIGQLTCMLSLVTAPLHAISTSMQLSVLPHLTVYGDVKESDAKKGLVREKLEGIGLLDNKSKASEGKEITTEIKHDLMKVEVRADLMKASGQVGLNKPYRAPVYRNYLECIQGLYRQGILGFYKGNGARCAHIFLYQILRNDVQY
jgi:Mitochondrial carrier protein